MIDGLKECSSLSEEDLATLNEFAAADFFEAEMGAEAIKKVLSKIDLDELIKKLAEEAKETKSLPKKKIYAKRKSYGRNDDAGICPLWLIDDMLPVIPPDLRPIIQLPGGRFATSDLNDLYRE